MEGSLEAPTRHAIPWQDETWYDEPALEAELRRDREATRRGGVVRTVVVEAQGHDVELQVSMWTRIAQIYEAQLGQNDNAAAACNHVANHDDGYRRAIAGQPAELVQAAACRAQPGVDPGQRQQSAGQRPALLPGIGDAGGQRAAAGLPVSRAVGGDRPSILIP